MLVPKFYRAADDDNQCRQTTKPVDQRKRVNAIPAENVQSQSNQSDSGYRIHRHAGGEAAFKQIDTQAISAIAPMMIGNIGNVNLDGKDKTTSQSPLQRSEVF